MSRRPHLRVLLRTALAGLLCLVVVAAVTPAASAAAYVPISGAGSTWSQNALDQWRKNVDQYGIKVNYAGTGSSDGRNQYRNGTVDFAVSEIPYGLKDGTVTDDPPTRNFAYMPIVAGGTSFMYNLTIGSKRVTNLRLSGPTLTKIFTGNIKMWNDPAVKADNPGLTLPARRVVPVVRSDGSGTTAQFTAWMSNQYGSLWNAYSARAGRSGGGQTSNYPTVGGAGFVLQAGSDGVSGYVAQDKNIGTITYVEYSYALNNNFPVAKVLNKSGYYTEPTASNTAVALLKAKINEDASSKAYLTSDLTGVYTNTDKRTYPLSSYSYMIVPTKIEGGFNEKKGKTLGDFAYYFLCEGQQQAPDLGYSPLPINLVKAGLAQVKRIPGVAAQNVDITKCNNPTFSKDGTNTLAKNAPQPPACDKQGATQCTTGTGGASKVSTANSSKPAAGTSNGTTTTTTGGTNTVAQTTTGDTGPATTDTGTGAVDPDTGQAAAVVATGTGDSEVQSSALTLASSDGGQMQQVAMVLAAGLLAAVVFAPPLVARWLRRRKTA